jgi:N-acetyl-anhydromuramyl-L-alanine amidase AmpD
MWRLALFLTFLLIPAAGCRPPTPSPAQPVQRHGDEIMACGQLFRIGTPVVLWIDPGGYDAYRVERRFVPWESSSWSATTQQASDPATPNRYGLREDRLTPDQIERVRGGGWDLPLLQQTVDQFVIHYDASGTSRECFRTLHDRRGLSVHFMLDLDGTIYQTLDLKERAWHAKEANTRSIGIEIANVGAYPPGQSADLDHWYQKDAGGQTRIVLPVGLGDGGIRTSGFVARPARDQPVIGDIQGQTLRMYDLTPQQYEALARLTAALCTIFPKITCDYPRDEQGRLAGGVLSADALAAYHGLIGHYHISPAKVDPGPAFQWDKLIAEARARMP